MILKLKSERLKSIIFLVITALLWSMGGMLIKWINWNPLAIAGMRSAIASVVLLIFIKKPKITWSVLQVGAALAYATTLVLFVSATKMTSAANAVLLQYTAPIYVAFFSTWLLNEKTKWFDWVTVSIVFGGMILFFLDHLYMNGILGNIIAAASGVSFAFFAIFMRMQKDRSSLESVFLGNIITAIIGIPFMFRSTLSTADWSILLFLGVIQLGIPYILYSIAIKHVTALEAVLIPILEPILNPIWVFLLLGEVPGKWAIIGGFIVLVTVTVRCSLAVIWEIRDTKNEIKSIL